MLGKQAWLRTSEATYLAIIMVIAPMLNFLAGISFDLYAPSMPAIARDFNASIVTVKNTITITMVGFGLGSLFLGVLIDRYGRKRVLVPSLFLYVIVSLLAPYATTINQLLAIRFFQGVFTAAAGIGSRAIIVDYFTGKRFVIAVLYTTIAYGLGLVMGPFFGGYLQDHYGWHANFYAYALIACALEILILLFLNESLVIDVPHTLWQTAKFYFPIVMHPIFIMGTIILSIVLIEQLIYPTIGVFIVQDNLGYSATFYGNTALLLGLSYLSGTLINRFLLNRYRQVTLIYIGFCIMFTSSVLQLVSAFLIGLNVWTLVIPILGVNLGLGFIFGNVLGVCLKLFPKNAGMNTAIQSCLFMLISSLGILGISYLPITQLQSIAIIFLTLIFIQILCFFYKVRTQME